MYANNLNFLKTIFFFFIQNPEFIFLHVAKQKDDPIKETNQQKISELYELPNKLEQFYMKMGLEDKLDNLFSFIKSHLKSKILIFFSTCKQVRFAYEAFKKLRLGIPLLELHGRQKQVKFCNKFDLIKK